MNLQVVVDFRVIDESDDWIVVEKPAPLIVHPANRKPEPTLLGGLEKLLAFEIENGGSLGIVTRLDRETSGLVLIAKNKATARELGGIFERREAAKQYLAVVIGWPSTDCWYCQEPILRAGQLGLSDIWVRQQIDPSGKECLTRFEVERRFERQEGRFSLIRCFPETGRMHQIRVHLASGGFPIVGDKIYSGNGSEYLRWMECGWTPILRDRLFIPRHALHAAVLEVTLAGRSHRWESGLTLDLKEFCDGKEISPTPSIVIWNRHD